MSLLQIASDVARQAGELIRSGGRLDVRTKSSRTDMVTETDRSSEKLIVDALRAVRPGDGVLGEEGSSSEGTSGVRWIIDPLDGTTNFLYSIPAVAVSIAAQQAGRTVAGVVYDCSRDELYAAAPGQGATCNGRPIAVSRLTDLSTALVGTGFSYDREDRRRQAQTLAAVLPRVRDIRRFGAAAIDLCWVACGRLDAFYEEHLKPWDVAAGELIVREAGGLTLHTTHHDIAACPGVFEQLAALL